MGWFTYKCLTHGDFKVSLEKRVQSEKCPICKTDSCAIIKTGSTSIVEKVDNGAMSRSIERLQNIEEVMNERADKHSRETRDPEDS
jgi:hypothetical protein